MNYFRLTMSTQWCGMDNEITIKTPLSEEELKSKHAEYFDEQARENLLSFMSEEHVQDDGYEVEEASDWRLDSIELEDFLEAIENDEVIEFLE